MSQTTSLYRHFDESGSLLYVGISLSAVARLKQHMDAAHWSDRITSVKIEQHPTRSAALDAECAAIQLERPLWNKANATGKIREGGFALSALFAPTSKKDAREQRSGIVAAQRGVSISHFGEELRQDDLDVLLVVSGIAPTGQRATTEASILAALKWGRSQGDYIRLRSCCDRLSNGIILVNGSNERRALMNEVNSKGGALARAIDPVVYGLMPYSGWSTCHWEQRLNLAPLAKWLHSFYFSNRDSIGCSVATLHNLCGSRQKALRAFKQSLKAALDDLVSIGFLASYELVGEIVAVRRQRAIAAA